MTLGLFPVDFGDGVGSAVQGVGYLLTGRLIGYGEFAALALPVVEKGSESSLFSGVFLL